VVAEEAFMALDPHTLHPPALCMTAWAAWAAWAPLYPDRTPTLANRWNVLRNCSAAI
jgi:hypothetical protein